jgi:subtilisin family serine protease
MKEYIVALKEGVDYDQVWAAIENPTVGLPHIPDRSVDIADNLDSLPRTTHYFLTDEEAELLRNDPRVLGVEMPAEFRDDIGIALHTIQDSNFTKTSLDTGDYVNWGLARHSSTTNVYGSSTSTAVDYNYSVNGSNVDIVIIDSGIQVNHPEFGTRVNAYQWTNVVNTTTFYTDYDGHGTHCAGISAGNTYGWAKNSNIYAIKFLAAASDPDQGFTGQSFGNIANILVSWQNSKPVNLVTGVKNPTVVNMSFTYLYGFTSSYYVANVTYRGNTYNSPGVPNTTYGLQFAQGYYPYRNPTYDVYVDQMTAAGMIVCKSGGNDTLKVDVNGGSDWNNSMELRSISGNTLYVSQAWYMRGGSPTSTNGTDIVVGALDSTTYSSTLDRKDPSYSNAGPGIDIFAAGSNIMSACSNTNTKGGQAYYWNNNFKQVNIGGTSMAAPQVAGIAALIAQANPTATPAQIKTRLLNTATATMIGNVATNPSGTDYGNTISQWGGNAGVALTTYNSANNTSIAGPITITNVTVSNN